MRNSGRYPLCGRGDINLYAIFAEVFSTLVNDTGRSGAILPCGIATDDTTKNYFQYVVDSRRLNGLFGFINEEMLFPSVLHNFKFCLLILGGDRSRTDGATIVFNSYNVEQSKDEARRFSLTSQDVALLNPNTRTCPVFFWRLSAEITKAIYKRHAVLDREGGTNEWALRFGTIFHSSNDSGLFMAGATDTSVALYEAKMFDQYNHRYGSYEQLGAGERSHMLPEVSEDRLRDPHYRVRPFWFVEGSEVDTVLSGKWSARWLLGFRNITSAGLWRTTIYSVLPWCGCSDKVPVVFLDPPCIDFAATFVGCMNSFVLDFVSRQKLGGASYSFFIKRQLPVPPPSLFGEAAEWDRLATVDQWVRSRVLELAYSAWDLEPFAQDSGWCGPPFRWDEERRFLLRCELDAGFFHLYLPGERNGDWCRAERETAEDLTQLKANFPTPRDAVVYIMDTFPIVRHRDEEKFDGDYRTKRVVLEIYDALAESIRTGQPYQSRVNPLPGPPMDTVGTMMSMYQLDRSEWPTHLHPPHPDWEESLLAGWFGVRQQRWTYVEEEQMFPWDGREAFAYAVIPYLVQERPGKKFEFYRDAALLASYPKRCETLLLEDAPRENYRLAMRGLDWLQFPDAHRIRPGRIREMLQGKEILRTDANSGATTLSSIKTLPPSPSELRPLIPLILNAADNLERVQRDALERVESTKLGVNKEDLTRELSSLMVA